MSFFELAKSRYSVRKFLSRPIEQEKLDRIIESGRIAPTAKNNQPQKVYILRSEEALEKINGLTPCVYGAPIVLMVCYDFNVAWHNSYRRAYDSGEIDSSIVCTHMMLEAWDLGIGSCWVGMFSDKEVAEAFSLPENIKPVALMPLGYPAPDAAPSLKHDTFRPKEETVFEL